MLPRLLAARETVRFLRGPRFADDPTDLRQVVELDWTGAGDARARVSGPVTSTVTGSWSLDGGQAEGVSTVEIGVPVVGHPGELLPLEVRTPDGQQLDVQITVAEPGWRMFMVSHFHYDPVWWTTQAAYLTDLDRYPISEGRLDYMREGMALVNLHLDLAEADPVYAFVLAEVDYLKPFWDTHPHRRDLIRQLLAQGRLELVGGTYNEPNTNLTCPESTTRNAQFGVDFQHGVIGGEPTSAWQLDVFGHDPYFPSLMRDAGLSYSAWGRGPFHDWGPVHRDVFHTVRYDAAEAMQFASEFYWTSPDGRSLLTHYMPAHYGAGWGMVAALTLAEAEAFVYAEFTSLMSVAATKNVLLPVGTDYAPPNRWVTEIHKDWNARYAWPRFESAVPRQFFAAVENDLAVSGAALSVQTRDMNPIFAGKDVSFVDTKQAQRAAENALLRAEKFGTVAGLLARHPFPAEDLELAWKQLAFAAHHDGITGVEGDQVYIDLLTSWRQAYRLGRDAETDALTAIAVQVNTMGPGEPVLVANSAGWQRGGRVRVLVDGPSRAVMPDGTPLPSAVTALPQGLVLDCDVPEVPALGYRVVHIQPVADPAADVPGWHRIGGDSIHNERYRIRADQARGGCLASIVDLESNQELLNGGRVALDLVVYDEHLGDANEMFGPWIIAPKGEVARCSQSAATRVLAEESELGQRLTVTGQLAGIDYTYIVELSHGAPQVDLQIRIDGFSGSDQLLRLEFPCDVPGARPLYDIGRGPIARNFGHPSVNAREHPYTLDNPAFEWAGLGATAVVREIDAEGTAVATHPIGVGEVVVDGTGVRASHGREEFERLGRDVVEALGVAGVTTTMSRAVGPRYGQLSSDSNAPDFRVLIGTGGAGSVLDEILASTGAAGTTLRETAARDGVSVGWVASRHPDRAMDVPSADVTGVLDLPSLVIVITDPAKGAATVADLVRGWRETAAANVPAGPWTGQEPFENRTVALINAGTVGAVVDPTGVAHVSLLRSSTGFPAGYWVDGDPRTAPDGSSFQSQHWSHDYRLALCAGAGDWRDLRLTRIGHDFNNPLSAVRTTAHDGPLPHTFEGLDGADVPGLVVTALKPLPARDPFTALLPSTNDVVLRAQDTSGRATDIDLRINGIEWVAEVDGQETDARSAAMPRPLAGRERISLRGALTGEPIPVPAPRRTERYARYWLHNEGPAPAGGQPLAAFVEPTYADAPVGREHVVPLRVTVSAETRDVASGAQGLTVAVSAPLGWSSVPSMTTVAFGDADFVELAVRLEIPADSQGGLYLVPVRLADATGVLTTDVISVNLGGRPSGADRPPVLSGVWTVPGIQVSPGQTSEFGLELTNHAATDALAWVRLAGAYETWDWTGPDRHEAVVVPAGGSTTLDYRCTPPPDVAPGHWWALAKVATSGSLHYLPTLPIEVVHESAGAI